MRMISKQNAKSKPAKEDDCAWQAIDLLTHHRNPSKFYAAIHAHDINVNYFGTVVNN